MLSRFAAITVPCLVAGTLAACGDDKSTTARRSSRPELGASQTLLVIGEHVTLRGQTDGGGPRRIELEADPYPFGSYGRVQRRRIASDGTFSFEAAPDRNTKYRIRQGMAASDPLLVFVAPRKTLKVYVLPGNRMRAVSSSKVAPGVGAEGAREVFYLTPAGGADWRRVGIAALKPRNRSRLVAVAEFARPESSGRDGYRTCTTFKRPTAMGRSSYPGCGKRTLPAP